MASADPVGTRRQLDGVLDRTEHRSQPGPDTEASMVRRIAALATVGDLPSFTRPNNRNGKRRVVSVDWRGNLVVASHVSRDATRADVLLAYVSSIALYIHLCDGDTAHLLFTIRVREHMSERH